MTISQIAACQASYGYARACKPRDGEGRVEVRTGPTGGDSYDAYCPSNIESPIQPPWRVLPWPGEGRSAPVRHTVAAAAVKAVAAQADVTGVGRTLDVFV